MFTFIVGRWVCNNDITHYLPTWQVSQKITICTVWIFPSFVCIRSWDKLTYSYWNMKQYVHIIALKHMLLVEVSIGSELFWLIFLWIIQIKIFFEGQYGLIFSILFMTCIKMSHILLSFQKMHVICTSLSCSDMYPYFCLRQPHDQLMNKVL